MPAHIHRSVGKAPYIHTWGPTTLQSHSLCITTLTAMTAAHLTLHSAQQCVTACTAAHDSSAQCPQPVTAFTAACPTCCTSQSVTAFKAAHSASAQRPQAVAACTAAAHRNFTQRPQPEKAFTAAHSAFAQRPQHANSIHSRTQHCYAAAEAVTAFTTAHSPLAQRHNCISIHSCTRHFCAAPTTRNSIHSCVPL